MNTVYALMIKHGCLFGDCSALDCLKPPEELFFEEKKSCESNFLQAGSPFFAFEPYWLCLAGGRSAA